MPALYTVDVDEGDHWKTYVFATASEARSWMDELIEAGVDEQWELVGPTRVETPFLIDHKG